YGLGYNICKLNTFIFKKFKENKEYHFRSGTQHEKNQLWDSLKFIFPNHKDLEKEYIDSVNRKLISWKIPDYINVNEWGGGKNRPYWHMAYLINGAYLMKSYLIPSYSAKKVELDEEFLPKSLLDFLDDVSPGLFLGKIKPKYLTIEKDSRISPKEKLIRIKEN
ncbi:hypothetical protein LCGC14_1756300, partial [marine sediment metagenome]